LIVETLGGHVRLDDGLKRSYVDADLHGRRDREKVYLLLRQVKASNGLHNRLTIGVKQELSIVVARLPLRCHEVVAKSALPVAGIICLARKLLAVQSKRASSAINAFRQEVFCPNRSPTLVGQLGQVSATSCTDPKTPVEMYASTTLAPPASI